MSALKRTKGLKRSPLKPKQPKRVWPEEKRGPCRVCGDPNTDLAHTVGRAYQDEKVSRRLKVVPAAAVVPLCRSTPEKTGCHEKFDGHRLSLLGLLTMPELRNAVAACRKFGMDARRRLGGGRP